MSVDERRETFHVNRIPVRDLDGRLLAQAYRPDVVAAVRTLESKGARPLAGALVGRLTQGRTPEYGDDGELCLKTRNIVGGLVDDSSVDRVSAQFSRANAASRISNETVLMNRSGAGSIGRVSIYIGADSVFTNEELFRFRIAAPHDPAFVAMFFSTSLGERILERGVNGSTGQLKLVQEHVEGVPVLLPHPLAQLYIGDKVRQAARLRERARRLETEFREAIAVTETSTRPTTSTKVSRVAPGELGRNLNPGTHTPDRRAVRAAMRAAGGRTLEELADVESPTADKYTADTPYVGLDAIDSVTCRLQPSTAAAEAVASTARLLREGPAISRLRPYLNKVTYIPRSIAGGIGSTELLLIRPKPGINGWFLYGVLKLDVTVRQLNPVATGSTHPRVDREDVLELLVPWRDDQAALGSKLCTAQACYFASAALTYSAIMLVERLIDGRIAEADLVAAQRGISDGDRRADVDILRALRQADSSDGRSHIPDLDGLSKLFDESDREND